MYQDNLREIEIENKFLQIRQDTKQGLGGVVWDCALVFIAWLRKNFRNHQEKYNIKGKKIIELGSGTGVCGLCFSLFNPSVLVLTDMPSNINLIKINKDENAEILKSKDVDVENIFIESLSWGAEIEDTDKINKKYGPFDLLIGTDLIYSDPDKSPLLETMEKFAESNKDIKVIMGYTYHKASDKNFFELAKRKWKIESIPENELDEEYQSEDIGIVVMTLLS